jgi:outer membrane biosynthesis protein TonB
MKNSQNRINGMTVDELLAFHRETFGDTRMEDDSTDEALTAAPAAVAESAVLPTDFESVDDEALAELLETMTADFDTQYSEGSRDIGSAPSRPPVPRPPPKPTPPPKLSPPESVPPSTRPKPSKSSPPKATPPVSRKPPRRPSPQSPRHPPIRSLLTSRSKRCRERTLRHLLL